MLVLAILSTVIISIIILMFFGALIEDEMYTEAGFIFISLLVFVIITIWCLYAR